MLSCAVIVALGIGVFSNQLTLAMFTDTDRATNVMNVGVGGGEIIENTDKEGLKENVGVKNTGTIACYVRAFAGIPDLTAEGIDFTCSPKNPEENGIWFYDENDGYFYYNGKYDENSAQGVVPADGVVILYNSIRIEAKEGADLKHVTIPIYAEIVQSDNIDIPANTPCPAQYAFSLVNK